MSWIDDNFYNLEEPDYYELEENWEKGIHIDSNGKVYKLSEMTDNHLKNTINFFKFANTIELEKELQKRLITIK
jgi:hypothetical protein